MNDNALLLLLSLAAGAATAVGGMAAVVVRCPGRRMTAATLGFSAGIMMTVSLSDLIPEAARAIRSALPAAGAAALVAACAAGMLAAALLDLLLPQGEGGEREGMLRLGVFSMLALLLHNLPEGAAVFLGGSTDRRLGFSLAVAIALHNIPEGISVALPIYAATQKRMLAVGMAAFSGLAEPLGGLLAWAFLRPVLAGPGLWLLFAGIAGLMLYIVFAELLPAAFQKNCPTCSLLGTMAGILLMVLSLSLL